MKKHKIFFTIIFVSILGLSSYFAAARTAGGNSYAEETAPPCFQDADEKQRLIGEAEQNEYNVKSIEISGNEATRHRVFVKNLFLYEGDIFTRRNLEKSIKGISKISAIKPISLADVGIRLDRGDKTVDLVFCVVEKKKN